MIRNAVLLSLMMSGAAFAQNTTVNDAIDDIITMTPLDEPIGGFVSQPILKDAVDESRENVSEAVGAVLRGLDKVNGAHSDLELASGTMGQFGRLNITVSGCRYPSGNPAGDAFAYLSIYDTVLEKDVFDGWMVASAPALNAMDHSRYDVWVLRCITE